MATTHQLITKSKNATILYRLDRGHSSALSAAFSYYCHDNHMDRDTTDYV